LIEKWHFSIYEKTAERLKYKHILFVWRYKYGEKFKKRKMAKKTVSDHYAVHSGDLRRNRRGQPAGHYLLVIEASESGKTISTSLHIYIT